MHHTHGSKNKTFVLEGNIGAGKSTFLDIVRKNLDIDVILEPTDKWQKIGASGNLLELFYNDTPRWAYTFQSYAFVSRVQALYERELHSTSGTMHLLERSVYCDRYCFAKGAYELGNLTTLEWQIYKEWFNWLVERYTTKPAGFVYLRVSPDICLKRLTKRSRSEESEIAIAYLELLHRKHEDWLINKKEISDFIKDVPVLVMDCNKDFEQDKNEQEKLLLALEKFVGDCKARPLAAMHKKIGTATHEQQF